MLPTSNLLTRGVANIIPSQSELESILRSSHPLNVYLGIDPTAPRIHLGHAVALRKLQSLVELGHNVTFLIGDFTALIGDTSDKESTRPPLSPDQIKTNLQTYQPQAAKFLDFSRVTLRFNSQWLNSLALKDILQLASHFSLNDFISRELIKKRLYDGKSISLPEVLYPLMQGYDSYFLDTDLQIGGTDQTFNMQAGRHLQRVLRGKESFILTLDFLPGTDGRKMSKSWGNTIWLDDSPQDIYGKVMRLPDELIPVYFKLATNLPTAQIPASGHPMRLKKQLAWQIVSELHSPAAADSAQARFESVHQQGQAPTNLPEFALSSLSGLNLTEALVQLQLAPSKSAARRLITQGGVYLNNLRMTNPLAPLKHPGILQVGPRRFVKLV